MDKIIPLIISIIDGETKYSVDKDALNFIEQQTTDILLPLTSELFLCEASKYFEKREEYNKNIKLLMNNELKLIKDIFNDIAAHIAIMSSVNAGTNLLGFSDVDIGICVEKLNTDDDNLDNYLFTIIKNKLIDCGYKENKVFNENNPKNRYFPFTKKIGDQEFEVKVRDLKTSQTIIKLHEYLDNKLSEERQMLYTYLKFLTFENKEIYKKLKKIIYESAFSHIDGGFVMFM